MSNPQIADKKTAVQQWRECSYSKYEGRSLGRVLYFIHIYCGLHYAERVQVGKKEGWEELNELTLPDGRRVATYSWLADTDIPVFQFEADFDKDGHYARRQIMNLEFPF